MNRTEFPANQAFGPDAVAKEKLIADLFVGAHGDSSVGIARTLQVGAALTGQDFKTLAWGANALLGSYHPTRAVNAAASGLAALIGEDRALGKASRSLVDNGRVFAMVAVEVAKTVPSGDAEAYQDALAKLFSNPEAFLAIADAAQADRVAAARTDGDVSLATLILDESGHTLTAMKRGMESDGAAGFAAFMKDTLAWSTARAGKDLHGAAGEQLSAERRIEARLSCDAFIAQFETQWGAAFGSLIRDGAVVGDSVDDYAAALRLPTTVQAELTADPALRARLHGPIGRLIKAVAGIYEARRAL